MALVPAISFDAAVPVRLERHAIQQTHTWQNTVEDCNHENRSPYDDCVDPGKLESKKVCANREFEDGDAHQIDNLSDPHVVAVPYEIVGLLD